MMLTGRIGGKVIVNEDINKFFEGIKDIDWTDNIIYKPAKICEVKPTFSTNNDKSHQIPFQSKLPFFDQYLIEENSNHLNDFKTYRNDVEDKITRVNDRITSQKSEFLQMLNMDSLDESSKKQEILEGIKMNLARIINNSKLKDRLGHLVNSMENQQRASSGGFNPNTTNQMNMNYNNQQYYNTTGNMNPQQQMGMGYGQGNQGMNMNMNMGYNNFNNPNTNTNFNPNQSWGNFNQQQPNSNFNNFNFK